MDDETGGGARPGDGARGRSLPDSSVPPLPDPSPARGEGLAAATPPLPARAAHESPSPSRGEGIGGEIGDFQGGCNRRLQLAKRGWNRFDAARRKRFLEWFAATCNAREAARRAGVAYSTVYRHRMLDARFAAAWDRALEQGYARLEAKLLEMQFEQAAGGAADFDGGLEPDAPDPKLVDPAMAMQLLRQHRAEVSRIRDDQAARRGRGRKALPFEQARLASDAEVRAALVKSLRAFGARVAAEDLKPGASDNEG